MFPVMLCLSGSNNNNISIGFQGLIERFGRRLRGRMLIAPEKARPSQKHIPLEFSFLCAGCQTSPSDKKKKKKLEAPKRSILSFLFQRMQCFVLTSAGKEMKGSVIKPKGLSVVIKWPFTPDL